MKCTACDTVNPDVNKFCMHCGKLLKEDVHTPVVLPVETASSAAEVAVEESSKPVDAEVLATSDAQQKQEDPSHIADGPTLLVQPASVSEESRPSAVELPTEMAANPIIEQEQTPMSTQAVPGPMRQQELTLASELPTEMVVSPIVEQEATVAAELPTEMVVSPIVEQEATVVAELPTEMATSPVVEQEATVAAELPTEMVVSPIVEQEQTVAAELPTEMVASPVIEQEQTVAAELPTEMAASPVIEQGPTPISTPTMSEQAFQPEPTVKRVKPPITPQNPMFAAEYFGDAAQPRNPAVPGGVQTPPPYQMPPSYPSSGEYANYSAPPSAPNYPGHPAPGGMHQSAPNYPSYPAPSGMHQSAPTYPAYPGYPQPPGMYPPGASGAEYPPVPAWSPNQAGGSVTPGYPMMPSQATPPPVKPKKIARIAQPLPIWVLIVSTIATLVILVILQLIGSDWADGAMRAATGAITIAVLLLMFAGVRVFFGMLNEANKTRIAQTIGSALAVVLLFVYSGVALLAQNPLHVAQAHVLEGQRQWQQAVNEYQWGGEAAPSSANLARTYDEWGEALSKSGQYTDAISKFDVVLGSYTTTDEVTRAQRGEASAYYNLAQSQLQAQQYNDAVTNFKTLLSRFANSPEAQSIHAPLATALLGKGKQDRASVCSSAIPTYQELAASYSDTPEGKAATDELSQPQPVKGHFTSSLPTDGNTTAGLVQNFNGGMSSDQAFALFDGSPRAPINGDGTFTFQPLKQGKYGLVWVINHPDGSRTLHWQYSSADPTQAPNIIANVGPLCPFDFGNLSQSLEPQQ